ncbi:MAG: hypothetical protein H6865_04705 [Rhodospirillales bacterium]|nr:hypothetical protein [Alphaproteobacteria bacterium]MCB9986918.1 hypothetical protein [Rhodospirillales bacterium]USO08306.1 MAG: hypothetical protein H6866_03585 [Rhodospirillales bacterium]
MVSDTLNFARSSALSSSPCARTLQVDFNGVAGWKKFSVLRPLQLRRGLLSLLAVVTGLGIFRDTYVSDPRQSLKFEARRFAHLRRAGFLAPEIVEYSPDWSWFVTGSIGKSLRQILLDENDPRARRALLIHGIEELARLHKAGQYHGRPYMRDIVLSPDGKIGWLDLEHDALRSMPLREAQARDALLYLLGATRYQKSDAQLLPHLLHRYARLAPDGAVAKMGDITRKLRPAALTACFAAKAFGTGRPPRAADVIRFTARVLLRPRPEERGAARIAARPA